MSPGAFRWLLVAVLWVVAVLNYVDRQVIFAVFPLLSADLGLSSLQLGLLSTVFLWVYGALSPFAGFVADRMGRARLIGVSLLVWSAVTLATGFSTSFVQLIIARGLMGISEACYLPAALARIAESHGSRTRSLAVGLHQSGLYAGLVLGGAAGGWAGQHYGWRAAFVALGAFGLVYFLAFTLFFRGDRVNAPSPTSPVAFATAVSRLLRLPGFSTLTLVFSAAAIANWLVYTWLPLYLYEHFHMSLAEAGFTATFYIQVSSLAGIVAGGWLTDRLSIRLPRARLIMQSVGVVAAGPFLFLLAFTESRGVLLTALVLYGLGRGLYDCNTMPVLCQIARDNLRSTGYGIFNFAGCIAGGAVAALAGGLKSALGLGAAFQLAGVILLLAGGMLLTVRSAREGVRTS